MRYGHHIALLTLYYFLKLEQFKKFLLKDYNNHMSIILLSSYFEATDFSKLKRRLLG